MEGLKNPFRIYGRWLGLTVRTIRAWRIRHVLWLAQVFRRTTVKSIDHDVLNVAQSSAYSAMIALFPGLIVSAAVAQLLPYSDSFRFQLAAFFERILPSDVIPILQAYFAGGPKNDQSTRAIILAALVSVTGASSVIATLMEGFRRAYDLPADCWGFWQRRWRAFTLVPLSLVPFAVASLLVVFGHFFTLWIASQLTPSFQTPVYGIAVIIRWTIALLGSTGVIAMIYHMGTPLKKAWHMTLPGAAMATAMWFVTTLVFGLYVTRYANYGQVYGSLGAGIALLFWLYIISLSILCGAEFNAQFFTGKTAQNDGPS